jgi:hypothetical protein
MAFSQNIHPVLFHHDASSDSKLYFSSLPFQRTSISNSCNALKIKSYEYLCVILKKIARKTINLKYEKNNKFPFVIRKVNPDFELLTNNLDKNALKKIIFDNK